MNSLKWKNTIFEKRQEIVNSTLHSPEADLKRSATVKSEWDRMSEYERSHKLRGLKNWRQLLTQEQITKIVIKNLPKPKSWIVTNPNGEIFETNGLGELIKETGINLYKVRLLTRRKINESVIQ